MLVPLFLFVIAAAVYAADQLSKNWVVTTLPEGDTVPVLGDFLQWHFVRNPGAAFSLASGQTWIFTILAAVVVCVILWQIRRIRSFAWALFLGLLLGGVLGNLTDRLVRDPGFPEGHVIDFILTPWMWFWTNPAIYNIADIGIVGGMGIFVILTLLGIGVDGSRHTREQTEPSEPAPAEGGSETHDDGEGASSDTDADTTEAGGNGAA